MSKNTKIWLITAASLVVLGLSVFVAVMAAYGWDFTKLGTEVYETRTYKIDEEFENISINTDTADICFSVSDDGSCKVIWHASESITRNVEVINGTLTVKSIDEREWYERLGVSFENSRITVCLPLDEYGSLSIKESTGDIDICEEYKFKSVSVVSSTGDISVKNITAESVALTVSTGEIEISNLTCEGDIQINVSTGKSKVTNVLCKNIESNGSTGDIILKNVVASEQLVIERSTGDVNLNGCDAESISITTGTGDVTGTLLSEKQFSVETDTGDIDVPKTMSGGLCEITTGTGDVEINIIP